LGPFSEPGPTVVDGKGRLAGLITSGTGVVEAFDCTYLTSVGFLLQRMLKYGFHANIFPSLSTHEPLNLHCHCHIKPNVYV